MGALSFLPVETRLKALQTVAKHHHISNPPPDSHTSMIDSLSDTFINAFSRVRKPDPRFIDMGEALERYEEGLGSIERLVGRGKNRVDGETDYWLQKLHKQRRWTSYC